MKQKIGNIISWIALLLVGAIFALSIYTVYNAKKTGEEAYLFGYRPIFIMTGSMEPTLKVNGIAITKKVNGMEDIKKDDIITYHVMTETGDEIKITHRIYNIKEDGEIITKGDNNQVRDNYTLTIDNVETKVVKIFNQTADIIRIWGTTTGKIFIVGAPICLIVLIVSLKSLFRKEEIVEENIEEKENNDVSKINENK